MADWRVARSLEKYRAQINAARPDRKKGADGAIGDAAHASRSSDHNPWVMDSAMGVVTAMDITHDPAGGVDTYKLAEMLRTKKDRRIKYVISNRRIFSSVSTPWTWRPYSGSNPHDHHVHVSVQSTKSLYDNTDDWDFGGLFGGASPPSSGEVDHSVLRRGDQGAEVALLQKLLHIEEDGYFGPNTEAAVTLFQRNRGLEPDGVVGDYTWRELEKVSSEPIPINNPVQTNIVCTMFGGLADPNNSAYAPYAPIDDEVLGCALPWRFPDVRHKVKITNRANAKSVLCDIVDIGPWNIDDPYWTLPAGRPQAETGRDLKGRTTNLAGIDVTPAADKAIELGGLGRVDWEFQLPTTGGEQPPDHTALQAAVEEIAKCAETIADASAQLATATVTLNRIVSGGTA